MLEFYNYNNELKQKTITDKPIHYDAIIMDLNMPIMDGHEACKQIQLIYKDFNERQIGLKDLDSEDGLDGMGGSDENYVNRRPLIIASSAHITEDIQYNCLSHGFDKITGIPFE